MGVDRAVHVRDDGIHGSDAAATSLLLAGAVVKANGGTVPELVLLGMASTDGVMGVVPAMLAERLGIPQLTLASHLNVEGSQLTARRESDTAIDTMTATLPAVVSVTDQINEPRYPSFKQIMAAKRRPIDVWALDELGLSPDQVGLSATRARVKSVVRRPPREQGTIVVDEGSGGNDLAQFLIKGKLL